MDLEYYQQPPFYPEFCRINPLSDDKILGLSKVKAFADDKRNVSQNIKAVFHRIENIVGKEENAGYQHFLIFPHNVFIKAFSSSASKVVIVSERVKIISLFFDHREERVLKR